MGLYSVTYRSAQPRLARHNCEEIFIISINRKIVSLARD